MEVYFHAENRDDAMAQAKQATNAFDDGFEEAWLDNLHDDKDAERVEP